MTVVATGPLSQVRRPPQDCFRDRGRSYRHRPRASITATAFPLRMNPSRPHIATQERPWSRPTLAAASLTAARLLSRPGSLLPTSAAGFDHRDRISAPHDSVTAAHRHVGATLVATQPAAASLTAARLLSRPGSLIPTSGAGFDHRDRVSAPHDPVTTSLRHAGATLVATHPCRSFIDRRKIAFATGVAPTDIGRGLRSP